MPPRSTRGVRARGCASNPPSNPSASSPPLQQLGYRDDLASNGVEAVESVERQTYDVILMDVQIPEMDGLEALNLVQARKGD